MRASQARSYSELGVRGPRRGRPAASGLLYRGSQGCGPPSALLTGWSGRSRLLCLCPQPVTGAVSPAFLGECEHLPAGVTSGQPQATLTRACGQRAGLWVLLTQTAGSLCGPAESPPGDTWAPRGQREGEGRGVRESEGQCQGYRGLGSPAWLCWARGQCAVTWRGPNVRPSRRVVRTKTGGGISAGPAL